MPAIIYSSTSTSTLVPPRAREMKREPFGSARVDASTDTRRCTVTALRTPHSADQGICNACQIATLGEILLAIEVSL